MTNSAISKRTYQSVRSHMVILRRLREKARAGTKIDELDAAEVEISLGALQADRWVAEQNVFEETAED